MRIVIYHVFSFLGFLILLFAPLVFGQLNLNEVVVALELVGVKLLLFKFFGLFPRWIFHFYHLNVFLLRAFSSSGGSIMIICLRCMLISNLFDVSEHSRLLTGSHEYHDGEYKNSENHLPAGLDKPLMSPPFILIPVKLQVYISKDGRSSSNIYEG